MAQPAPEFQIQFLGSLQRLLSEGSFVSTYKYALLMALADLSVEHGSDDETTLEVPTRQIAEKFVHYYWRQSAPFLVSGAAGDEAKPLRSSTGAQAVVVRQIAAMRGRHNDSLADAGRSKREWPALVRKVDDVIRQMPLWKLQTVGRERLDFLYENTGAGRVIVLKPGVAYCFRRHHPLVSDLVRGAWVRFVRRLNLHALGTATDLNEFLFGSERVPLATVRPILMEFQKGECFYCHRALRDEAAHVDHFIPWSRYPVDLGHNFVLSHASCNGRKSDRLACADHLNAWVDCIERVGSDIGREFGRCDIIHDLPTSVKIVNWAYSQTFDCHGMTWVRGDELQPLPENWKSGLQRLNAYQVSKK